MSRDMGITVTVAGEDAHALISRAGIVRNDRRQYEIPEAAQQLIGTDLMWQTDEALGAALVILAAEALQQF